MLPLALAHAGLATNDTLVTGTLTLAFFTWALWLELPTRRRAIAVGAAAALAFLSKFTAIPFFGAVVLVSSLIWLMHTEPDGRRARLRTLVGSAALAAAIGFLVLWAGYQFSFAPIANPNKSHPSIDQIVGVHGGAHDLVYRLIELPVPAPEFPQGLRELADHVRSGHWSYLLGETFNHGRWSFFPIGILVKTPIAFLVLATFGLAVLAARCKRKPDPVVCLPLLGVVAMVAVTLPATINIGMRHILPIFPLLAIAIGAGIAFLWQRRQATSAGLAVAFALFAWLTIASVRAHPDYLAYFNECCDQNPDAWLVDSDLDWGQDLDRLAATLKRKGVEQVDLAYFGSADVSQHGLPHTMKLQPGERVRGWIAVSEFRFVMGSEHAEHSAPFSEFEWLGAFQPFERVGRSIRLYHVPKE